MSGPLPYQCQDLRISVSQEGRIATEKHLQACLGFRIWVSALTLTGDETTYFMPQARNHRLGSCMTVYGFYKGSVKGIYKSSFQVFNKGSLKGITETSRGSHPLACESEQNNNIGAFKIRIRFWCILYYTYNKEPPKQNR